MFQLNFRTSHPLPPIIFMSEVGGSSSILLVKMVVITNMMSRRTLFLAPKNICISRVFTTKQKWKYYVINNDKKRDHFGSGQGPPWCMESWRFKARKSGQWKLQVLWTQVLRSAPFFMGPGSSVKEGGVCQFLRGRSWWTGRWWGGWRHEDCSALPALLCICSWFWWKGRIGRFPVSGCSGHLGMPQKLHCPPRQPPQTLEEKV